MKKAIIVGASSEIGKGLAKLLAENNYKVGIAGRNIEVLNELKETNPNLFFVKIFDSVYRQKTTQKLDELALELGGLDLLIFSSGNGKFRETSQIRHEKEIIDLNILGFRNITNWGFNFFEKQKFGHIIAITTTGGLRSKVQAESYDANRTYQMKQLDELREQVEQSKNPIYVTDIKPELMNTNESKGKCFFWINSIEKASDKIFQAVKTKDKVVYITNRWGFLAKFLKKASQSI